MTEQLLLTNTDTEKAKKIWLEYQRLHDLTNLKGQTAGIDPKSGQVWLGNSIQTIVNQRLADGLTSPLVFERIGSCAYYFKGRHS